ncbi:MAG TPA: ferredoxin [Acidimicrobiales bacterium]|nr:ferredoxin [Acidimicrobiales bacterium]
MKLQIDAEACTGHGRCYVLAPDLFEPDDYGHGALLHEEVPPGLEEQARLAVSNCPEQAISVEG